MFINRCAYFEHQKLKSVYKFDPLREYEYLKNRRSKHEKKNPLTREELKLYLANRDFIEEGLEHSKFSERNLILSMVVNSRARTSAAVE